MCYNNWLQCTARQRTLTNGHSQAVKWLFHVVLGTTHIHIKKLFNMNEHKLKIKILFVTLRVTLTWISITLAFYDDLSLIFFSYRSWCTIGDVELFNLWEFMSQPVIELNSDFYSAWIVRSLVIWEV